MGMRYLVGFILFVSSMVSAGLWFLGAWPVIGFNVVEISLAVVLLRQNARRRRSVERLILSAAGLQIVRTDPAGRQWERRLQAGWLQAVLEERPGRTPALLLIDRGRQQEVGADLGEAEKRDLADALRAALHRQRHPVFDNPQLRTA